MVRVIAGATTVAWLFLVFICIVALCMDSETLTRSDFAIGIALVALVCCVIGVAVYSIFRSTRTGSLLLLLVSLVPGYVFGHGLWRLQDPSGARFLEILRRGDYDWFRLLEDIVFIGLPFCWAVVSLKVLKSRPSHM